MNNCNKYLFGPVMLGPIQFVLCIILDIKVCKRRNGPTHHFSTSPDDFYRQNWPFLLLDTSLNVGLCQHFLSHILHFLYTFIQSFEERRKVPNKVLHTALELWLSTSFLRTAPHLRLVICPIISLTNILAMYKSARKSWQA